MLNLEELVFKVNTKELTEAVTSLEKLEGAVQSLGEKSATINVKVKQTSSALKEQDKAAKDTAESTAKLAKNAGEAAPKMDSVTRTLEKQLTAMQIFRGETITVADGVINLGSAFTKTQANQLAMLKVSGATSDALKTMARSFEDFNKITSANTFDNSVAGIQRLRKEISEMNKVNELMAQGVKLTRDEIVNLVRDSERLTQQFQSEGLSAQQLDVALRGLEAEHVALAKQKNDLVAKSKESERQAKAEANAHIKAAQDQAKAVKYLEDVERRMAAAVDEANAGLDRGATDALVKYKQALIQAGIAADVAEAKMATLKSQMDLVASRKRAEDLKYLSRALSVQMGDVAISLASGMNPLLVMIQQGDQIRGVLDQVGAKGDELKNSMTAAAAQIATGMKNTAIAIGSFLGGAIMSTGKGITNLTAQITGTDKALLGLKARIIALEGITTSSSGPGMWSTAFNLASKAVVTFTGVITGIALAAVATYGVALYKVIQEEDALAKQLALTGGAMGLSFSNAMSLAQGMESVGVSTGKAMKILGEMAKVGGFTANELTLVAKAAADMQTYFGVAIEDTVKSFAKMKKDPVEAMFELAKTTGMVSTATIKSVVELKEQGKTAEATAIAIKTLADVNSQQVDRMKKDYNGFSLFMIELGKSIKSFYDEVFKSLFYKTDPKKQLQNQIGAIEEILNGGGSIAGALARTFDREGMEKNLGVLREQLKILQSSRDMEVQRAAEQSKTQSNYQEFLKDNTSLLNKQQKMKKELDEAERKFLPLVKEGLVTQEQYNQYVANIRDKYKETNKEVNELEKYMNRIQESVRDISVENSLIGKQEQEITRAVKLRADLLDDPLWSKLTEQGKVNLQAALDILDADERRLKWNEEIRKVQLDSLKAYNDYREKVLETHADSLKSLMDEKRTLTENADLLSFQWSLIGKTEEEAKLLTREYERQQKSKQAEYEYWKAISELNNKEGLSERERAAEKFILDQNYAEKQRQINSETAKLAAEDYDKEFKRIRDSITDSIVTALFEGGKAGGQKLRSMLIAELKKPITLAINAVVTTLMNKGMNFLGLSTPSTEQSGGGGSGINIGAGGSLTTMVGSGLSSLGSTLGIESLKNFGAGMNLGSSALNMMGGVTGAGQLGALFADVIPYIGWIMAAAKLLKAFKTPGEQHTGGFYSSSGQGSAMGLTGNEGWSRDLTKRANPEIENTVKTVVDSVISSTQAKAKLLGLDIALGIDAGFAANTNGKAKNKNAFGYFNLTANGETISEYVNRELGSDVPKAIEQWTADMVEAANKALLKGKEDLALEGETATQTLDRLANNLTGINKAFDLLGKTVLSASLTSAEFASDLVAAFGSLESFNTAVSSYYEKYYSESERFATSQRQLTGQFTSLNLSVPATTAEFRKLVESQDLNTEAGRQMYASLLNLAPAFYEVASAIEGVMQSISDTTANSIREIEMSILNEKDKYEYLDKEIVGLIGKLSTATLPADIEKIFNQINSDITNAYGLLSESEKKRLAPEFIDRFNEAERLAQERLKIAEEQGLTQAQAAEKQVKAADAALAAAEEIRNAAAEYMEAAKTMLEAAKTEQTIKVDIGGTSGTEVNFA